MPPEITDQPPPDVRDQIAALSADLDRVVPAKEPDRNLLVATWNVRGFDRINRTWRSSTGDSPIRDLSNILCIAEILRRFDVVAIQEVRRSAEGFLAMMQLLGESWSYLVTDVTRGAAGNSERLAFVFNRERVRASGLACELVVAAEEAGLSEEAMSGQFARTPYAASFTCGEQPFTLVTLHVLYGSRAADRLPELREIARWLSRWAREGDRWGENLLALGDFNIDRKEDPLAQAFFATGLEPPDALNHVPRTVFDDPDPNAPPDARHFYDQIAWFTASEGTPALSLRYTNAGMFNFALGQIPAASTVQLSWRISDHFPLWVEFAL
ncbi:MAG: endonuclease/exonuclease/phosphatase family protein [Actinomycetota bacterium]